MVEAGKPNLVDYFPILAKIDPQGIRHHMTIYFGKILELFGTLIDERLESRRSNENDVLDTLLNTSEHNSEEIDRTHIERLFLDLFVAGTDTTLSTIEWAMAEILHNHKIIKKAKTELEQTIGKGKILEESDIPPPSLLASYHKRNYEKAPTCTLLDPS